MLDNRLTIAQRKIDKETIKLINRPSIDYQQMIDDTIDKSMIDTQSIIPSREDKLIKRRSIKPLSQIQAGKHTNITLIHIQMYTIPDR